MITYDPAKREANLQKHGLDLAIAESVLAGNTLTLEDVREGYGEVRLQTLGTWNGIVVFVVHTPRNDADHIISIRRANKHEASYYWSQYPRPR